ncbi:Na+/H+ antiporter NhaA [Frigidibacter sp. ROC022]|uniref:Na+/H+ antiporter NhaA n=1 Tax=Frigidibacter sp. ROC022 TaxID=2971796 RepID=UPI00215A57D3|nr:Na+/H+ antiporter NhaA [Frigidibacter sp. ROC022]MCR8722971.1 Na+/H+ antiporter NhaA [Frigidibacter sp. ROC022]
MPLRLIDRLIRHEAAGGVLLILAALAALLVANSQFEGLYATFLDSVLAITVNDHGLEKPLILWINDGLMAIFFFLIGLELKREMLEGKLRRPRDVVLPGLAAVGGMALPALVYTLVNWGNAETIDGWAIPAATDIAFALGILALVGSRAPASLKVFLLTLAILDDLGAIIIIALFYTADLNTTYLMLALLPLAVMLVMNLYGVHRVAPLLLLGTVMWVLVLKSGVHATLAGVATAFLVPMTDRFGKSPVHRLEHGLTPYVGFLIVPLFAFANAGVVLTGLTLDQVLAPLPLGISAGLLLGKFAGIMGTVWLLTRLGMAQLPHGATWSHMAGVACLAGIGFTMSLFIGGLSFSDLHLMNQVRLGVLAGSGIAAVLGFTILMLAPRQEQAGAPATA